MCYGVEDIPEGDWYCDTCSVVGILSGKSIKCVLCNETGGALKPTDRGLAKMLKKEVEKGGGGGGDKREIIATGAISSSTTSVVTSFGNNDSNDGKVEVEERIGGWANVQTQLQSSIDATLLPHWAIKGMIPSEWAHVLCASYVPEVTFEDVNTMAPIVGLNKLHPRRCKLTCRICHKAGGAPVQCSRGICGFAVHVTCARIGKLEMLLEEDKRTGTSRYVVHCNKHADSSQDDISRFQFPYRKAVERATFRLEVESELTALKTERDRIASKVSRRAERDSWLRGSMISNTPSVAINQHALLQSDVLSSVQLLSDANITTASSAIETTGVITQTIDDGKSALGTTRVIGIASSPPLCLPDAVLYEAMSLQSDAAAVDNANYDSASEVETEFALSATTSSGEIMNLHQEGGVDNSTADMTQETSTQVVSAPPLLVSIQPIETPIPSTSPNKLTKAQRRLQAGGRGSSSSSSFSATSGLQVMSQVMSQSPAKAISAPVKPPINKEEGEQRPFSSMSSGLTSSATLWPAMSRYFSHVSPSSLQPFFLRYTDSAQSNVTEAIELRDPFQTDSSMSDVTDSSLMKNSSEYLLRSSPILEVALQPVYKQLMLSREKDAIDSAGMIVDTTKGGSVVIVGSTSSGKSSNSILSGYPPPLQPDLYKSALIEAVLTEVAHSEESSAVCPFSVSSSSSSTEVPPHSWVRIVQSIATRNGNLNSSFLTEPNIEVDPLLLDSTRYKPFMNVDGYFKGFSKPEDGESSAISTTLDLGPLSDIVHDNLYKHNNASTIRLVAAGRTHSTHVFDSNISTTTTTTTTQNTSSSLLRHEIREDFRMILPSIRRRDTLLSNLEKESSSQGIDFQRENESSIFHVPQLGSHYSLQWIEEDEDDNDDNSNNSFNSSEIDGSITGPIRPDLQHSCASLAFSGYGTGDQLTEHIRSTLYPLFTPNMLHVFNKFKTSLSSKMTFRFAKPSDARVLHVLYSTNRTNPPPFSTPGDFRTALKIGKNEFILLALEDDHIIGFIIWKCRLFKATLTSSNVSTTSSGFRFSRVLYVDEIYIVPRANVSTIQKSDPIQLEQNKIPIENDLDPRLVQKTWYPPSLSFSVNPGGSYKTASWLLTFALLFGQYFGLHAALIDLQREDEEMLKNKLLTTFRFTPLESKVEGNFSSTPFHLSLGQEIDVQNVLEINNSTSSASLSSQTAVINDWEDEVERELRDSAACLDALVQESRGRIQRLTSKINKESKKRSEPENQRHRRLERRIWRVYGNEEIRRNEEKEDERKRAEEESDAVCSCCGGGDSFVKNFILFCERPGCNLAVHQHCYGIPSVPAGEWMCAPCSGGSALHPSMISCVLCGIHGGPLRPVVMSSNNNSSYATVDVNRVKQWCHPHCARLLAVTGIAPHVKMLETGVIVGLLDAIPSVSLSVENIKNVIRDTQTTSLDSTPSSWLASHSTRKICCVCGTRLGVCIPCSVPGCSAGIHPLCALECGLISPLPPQAITPPLEELSIPRGVGAKRGEVLVATASFVNTSSSSLSSSPIQSDLCFQPFFADTVLPLHPSRLGQLLVTPMDSGQKSLYVYCATHKLAFPGRLQEGAQEDNEEWDIAGVSGIDLNTSAPKRSKKDKSKASAIATSLAFGGSGLEVRPLKDLLSASQISIGTPFLPPRRHCRILGDILYITNQSSSSDLGASSSNSGGDLGSFNLFALGIDTSTSHSTVLNMSKKSDSYALRSGVAPLLLPCSAPISGGPVFVPLIRALVSLYGFFVNVGALNTARRLCSALQPNSCRRKFVRLHEAVITSPSDEAKADLKKAIKTIYGKNCYLETDVRDIFGVTDSSQLAADDDDNNDEEGGGRRNVKMRETLRDSEKRDEERLKELDERIAKLEEKAAAGPDGVLSSNVVQLSSLGPEGIEALSPRSKNRPSMLFARSFLGILEPPVVQYSEFCSCHEMRDEPMVGCDTENCPFFGGWMHLKCAGLEAIPDGETYYCAGCLLKQKSRSSQMEIEEQKQVVTSRIE
jgi:hypothetical protein